MFCRNCGEEVDNNAVVCVHCGLSPRTEKKYCSNCGVDTDPNQTVCTKCGVALSAATGQKSKSIATLLSLLLGAAGAHKFYMGSWGWGIVYLLTFWWLYIPIIVNFVELIRYILMTDDEFNKKALEFQKSGPFGFFW